MSPLCVHICTHAGDDSVVCALLCNLIITVIVVIIVVRRNVCVEKEEEEDWELTQPTRTDATCVLLFVCMSLCAVQKLSLTVEVNASIAAWKDTR